MESEAPLFPKGTAVEVSSDEPGFAGAWFEATVVRCSKKKRRLSVEYEKLIHDSDSTKRLREVVEVRHVRPRPPAEHAQEEFRVGDKVEASSNDGWWAGEVMEVLDGDGYVVKFQDNDELLLGRSDLRVRLDWVEGKWTHPSLRVAAQWRLGEGSRKKRTPVQLGRLSSRNVPMEGMEHRKLDRKVFHEVLEMPETEVLYDVHNLRSNERSSSPNSGFVSEGVEMIQMNKCSYKRMNGPPLSENDPVMQDCSNDQFTCATGNSLYKDISSSDLQQIEMMLDTPNADLRVVDKNERKEDEDNTLDTDLQKLETLPLVKISPLWKAVDSMKIFKILPQNPHFRPLGQVCKERREGIAIGLMVTFANLVENMLGSQISEPTCVFENRLELLGDLEDQGFDLQVLRSFLVQMIKKKKLHEQCKSDLDELGRKFRGAVLDIHKLCMQVGEIEKRIPALEKSVVSLHEKLDSAIKGKEKCSSETTKLEKYREMLMKSSYITKQIFERTAAAPLTKTAF